MKFFMCLQELLVGLFSLEFGAPRAAKILSV
jgi:hypothetical protein